MAMALQAVGVNGLASFPSSSLDVVSRSSSKARATSVSCAAATPSQFHTIPSRLSSASSSSLFQSVEAFTNSSAWKLGHRAKSGQNAAKVVNVTAVKKEVLIVNTNSGGHAAIGFYFAKDLVAAGHAVTIFTVGEESSDKNKKPPFSRFSELTDVGVKTMWGNPSDIAATIGGAKFDVVLDNNGKDWEAVQPVADWAKSTGAKQFLFISSAGIYNVTDEPPHVEGDAVKSTAGHVIVEEYLKSLGFESWASFRPQYMTGSGNNKDCEEWFFDRIVRGRPVPIPEPGLQLTNIAHISDVSSILTLAVQKPEAANGQIFNAVCDRAVTLAGFARLAAAAVGKDVEIVLYNPKAVGVDAKKSFPFRITHFYAEPRAARDLLGFVSKTNLPETLKERYEEYVKIGRDKKDLSSKFELDEKILSAVKQPVTV
ncbi:unnamed protein product [Calypogeia fissa]